MWCLNLVPPKRQGGHLRPQNAVTYDHRHLSRILGHLWPQSAVTYDHRTSYSLTGPTKPPQCMGSLVTTECGHLRPQNTMRGGVGGGGVGGMITYLGLHTDTPKGGLVYRMITYLGLHTDTPKGGLVFRLWACTHAGPFWWVGVGWVGW